MMKLLVLALAGGAAAFSPSPSGDRILPSYTSTITALHANDEVSSSKVNRRAFLSTLPYLIPIPIVANAAALPVQQAVGSAESKCREEGNCLEKFELDGAVGWNWGGTERCDAREPLCGPDGRLRDEALSGEPVPSKNDNEITDLVELTITIGTGSIADTQTIKMGLYGNACPELVREMKDLCSNSGIVTSKDLLLGAPVRLGQDAGSMTYIRPEERLEFGVGSQKVAYAKSIRKAKAPDEFVPQERPTGQRLELVQAEKSSRNHDVAGLISLPKDGIGYGGGFTTKDDEAYSSAFQITAKAVPDMDKEGRKVIGQLVDDKSMALLARLSGSPTRKMVPGQNGGSPLIKVTVNDAAVYKVADLVAKE